MLYGYGVLFVAELCMVVYCALNVITTPAEQVRNLPKLLWLALVLVFPIVGGVAWLVAGRPQGQKRGASGRSTPSAYDRPGRAVASNPDDDADFLRGLQDRADAQRRQAEEERRKAQGDT